MIKIGIKIYQLLIQKYKATGTVLNYLLLMLFCSSAWAGWGDAYNGSDLPGGTYAMTFDDGPSDHTLTILNELDKQGIKATFFVVSDMTREREWIVKEMIARGHSVGCHSCSHPLMTNLEEKEWKRQIDDCVEILERMTRTRMELFRFPYGASTLEMKEYVRSKGMKVVSWSIDSFDWKMDSAETLKHLKSTFERQNRGVVLMHDTMLSTTISLPEILDFLKKKGAHFVKLDDCIEIVVGINGIGMEITSSSVWRNYIDNYLVMEENSFKESVLDIDRFNQLKWGFDNQKRRVVPLHEIQSKMISLPVILDHYFKSIGGDGGSRGWQL